MIIADVRVRILGAAVEDDIAMSFATLHRRTGLTVATGENLYGREAFEPYLARPEIGVLQPDVSKVGGLTEALAVCRRAEACGRAVAPHHYGGAFAFAATLGLAGAVPSVRTVEYDVRENPLRDGLLTAPPRVVDGHVAIPSGPGLGLAIDAAALEALNARAAPA
jgi:L-alanine-DL-glutamate epimerase-like enolase superfamily enzyme